MRTPASPPHTHPCSPRLLQNFCRSQGRENLSTESHLWASPGRPGAQQDRRQMPVWTAGWRKEVAFSAHCLGKERET